jgi:hypothetical protein
LSTSSTSSSSTSSAPKSHFRFLTKKNKKETSYQSYATKTFRNMNAARNTTTI